MIQSTEIHFIATTHDAALLEVIGLPTLPGYAESCANCGAEIGCAETFIPLAVVLNETTDWRLCVNCVLPALTPRG